MGLDERLQQALKNAISPEPETPWIGDPLDFLAFVEHPDHMAFPHLSDKQKMAILSVLGSDPKKMFDPYHRNQNLFEVLVLLVGKGSGKGMMTSFIFCYIAYVLLHLKNPQNYLFGMDLLGEPIDIINVAPSADQAGNVFFEKFRQRVMNWKWLKSKYKIKSSGRELNPTDRGPVRQEVMIHPYDIVFPANIRFFSRHSKVDTVEGFSILAWTIDEASGFAVTTNNDYAQKIYDMLRTSSQSRFPGRAIGIVQSFPRYKDDFTIRLYEESQTEGSRLKGVRATTWDMKPRCFSGVMVDVVGIDVKVPIELKDDFEKRPIDSLMKYVTVPPDQQHPYIEYPERIDLCLSTREPLATFIDDVVTLPTGKQVLRKKFVKWNHGGRSSSISHSIFSDRGETGDGMCLVVAHLDGQKVIVDLILEWFPDPHTRIPVDITDVETVIQIIRSRYRIGTVGSDHWQASGGINQMHELGIAAEKVRLNAGDYDAFKQVVYNGQIDIYNHEVVFRDELRQKAVWELKKLQSIRGRVDHAADSTNEISVCLVGVTKALLGGGGKSQGATDWISGGYTSQGQEGFFTKDLGDKDIFPGLGSSAHLR